MRENGYRCEEGVGYYAKTKQRVRVVFDDDFVRETEEAIARAWETAARSNYRRPTYPEVNSERTPILAREKGPPRWIRSSAWSESASRCSASASLHLSDEASSARAALLKSHGIKQVRPLRGGVDAWESMMRARD